MPRSPTPALRRTACRACAIPPSGRQTLVDGTESTAFLARIAERVELAPDAIHLSLAIAGLLPRVIKVKLSPAF